MTMNRPINYHKCFLFMAICGHKKQCFLFHPLIYYGQLIARNLNGFCKSLRSWAIWRALSNNTLLNLIFSG